MSRAKCSCGDVTLSGTDGWIREGVAHHLPPRACGPTSMPRVWSCCGVPYPGPHLGICPQKAVGDALAPNYIRVHNLHAVTVMSDVAHPKHPAIELTGTDNHQTTRNMVIVGTYDELTAFAYLLVRQILEEKAKEAAHEANRK